jgi:hypothetical protein
VPAVVAEVLRETGVRAVPVEPVAVVALAVVRRPALFLLAQGVPVVMGWLS